MIKTLFSLYILLLSINSLVYSNEHDINVLKFYSRHVLLSSKDTTDTQKVVKRWYKSLGLSPTADLRSVDGLFLGIAYRSAPDSARLRGYVQKISALKSLRAPAFIVEYSGTWKSAFKNTDVILYGVADMKGNILNFYGRGNNTIFDRTDDHRVFYRVNFSFYQLEPALRFNFSKSFTMNIGPALQYFKFNQTENEGRYINTPFITNQYSFLRQEKAHGGGILNLNWDTRDDKLLPTRGINFNVRVHGFEGLNDYSKAYAQWFPQISFYQSIDRNKNIVLANRTGAGFTFGTTEFYQSAFLGSQDNLLGYRKFRFAGDNLLYNNLEARISLPGLFSKIHRRKLGLLAFYDVGRVWLDGETSNTIHHGYGGGVYLTPRNRFFIRGVAGFSNEGMQATVALRQRF